MIELLLDMFKSRREKHLERLAREGSRAEATVLEIAEFGSEIEDRRIGRELVRKCRLQVRPEGEPEFDWEGKMRFGYGGRRVPNAGDRIEVMYEGSNPSKIEVAPVSAAENKARADAALSDAKIGFTVGGGRLGGDASPEQQAQAQDAMQQAIQAQEMMQQFLSGERKPGSQHEADADADADEKP
jgi:hypothetical protein